MANAEIRDVAVSELYEHPANPRRGDVSAIVASFRANGFYGTLTVQRSTMRVLAGNHRLRAARQLGMGAVSCAIVDVDEATALRILLADNRTSDLATYDDKMLADALTKLDGALAGTGFRQRDLDELLRRLSAQPAPQDDPAFLGPTIIDAAIAHWRATGFPYPRCPLHVAMQEINDLRATDDGALVHSHLGGRVADSYHPQRFRTTQDGKVDAVTALANDEKGVRKAVEVELLNGRKVGERLPPMFFVTRNVYVASNFRPGFALWLLRRFCPPGGTWLDTSTGYGGRLVGFVASRAGRYVGIDPSTETCANNTRMARDLGVSERVSLINLPAEDVPAETLADSCDFAFTSPPYFSKEHYADGESTQSWVRYGASIDAWLDGFLRPTMRLQHTALKTGSWCLVNIADVTVDDGVTHPLADMCREAGEAAGFTFVRREDFPIPGGANGIHDSDGSEGLRSEPVLVFRK